MKRRTEKVDSPAAWTADDLETNPSRWIFPLDDAGRAAVARAVKTACVPDKPLFAYTRDVITSYSIHYTKLYDWPFSVMVT